MEIFKLQGKLIIDESKPTVIFMDKGDLEGYTHIYGAARIVKEKIKDQFNIITMGAGCGLTDNYYEIRRNYRDSLLRKADSPEDYLEQNSKMILDAYANDLKDLPKIDYIILGTDDFFRLPLTGYCSKSFNERLSFMQNEFFDYTGDDQVMLYDIAQVNSDLVQNWDKKVSPIAFSTADCSIFMSVINFIDKNIGLRKVIGFAIDPAIYTPYFDVNGIHSEFCYFADDKRGTRNFHKWPIAQIQHIVYDRKFGGDDLDEWMDDSPECEKTHNMFFAGTVFQEKGQRKYIWDEFLNDVKTESCSYYIPLRKNGIIKKDGGKASDRQLDMVQERFPELYESVTNHQHFKGGLAPHELHDRQKRYKYGMVFRCVSENDSLNFRPVLYTIHDIVPFLDYKYDPECLQIPKHIQDKILVKNAQDIEDRITYFNNNEQERIEVLRELRDLFEIDVWENEEELQLHKYIKQILPEFK